MTTQYRTIRPGFLVSLSTSLDGGVDYERIDLEPAHLDESGQERSRWDTTKIVVDPAEFKAAVKVRSKCRALITGVCTASARHLLCPYDREQLLREKIAEARELAWKFNQSAKATFITISVLVTKVATDDQEAALEINREFRQLIDMAEQGVAQMNKKQVQDAASRMKDLGQVFNPDSQVMVEDAVKAFRVVARKIGKAGEAAALEIDEQVLATLRSARTAFLDLSESGAPQGGDGVDEGQALADEMRQRVVRAIDFDAWNDEEPAQPAAPAAPALEMDWDTTPYIVDPLDPFDGIEGK